VNRQEAGKVVAVIVAACPAQSSKLDASRVAAMVDTFAALLDDLSYEQVNAAVRVLLQTRTWMPSVADIRQTVLEFERGPVRAGGQGWGDFLAAVGRYGAYRSPQFDDPLVARVVAALGWKELCLSENQVADRARFVELYDKLAAQGQREGQSPMLAAAREARELEQRSGTTLGDAIAGLLAKGNS
jgi:hypothetical protein